MDPFRLPIRGSGIVLIIIGMVVVLASVGVGYTMHGGNLAVLVQVNEYIVIGGSAAGALMVGNKPSVVKGIIVQTLGILKPNPYGKKAFRELLQVLYEVFYVARKDGLVGIESHVEDPESSELFQKYPSFYHHHEAVAFLSDTMKVLLTGAVDDHHLSEILDLDLEKHHHQATQVPTALAKVADALPGLRHRGGGPRGDHHHGQDRRLARAGGYERRRRAGGDLPGGAPGLRRRGAPGPGHPGRVKAEEALPGHHPHRPPLLRPGRSPHHLRGVRPAQHRARRPPVLLRAGGPDPAEREAGGMSKDGRPIIIVRKRRQADHEEHGGAWKVAYADFVTAMMAFFLVMWLLGMSQEVKDLVQGYFSNPVGFKKALLRRSQPPLLRLHPRRPGPPGGPSS